MITRNCGKDAKKNLIKKYFEIAPMAQKKF